MPRTRRVDCSEPGITRRRRGKGFEYFDVQGDKIVDPEVIQRCKDLAIPPAWEDVWICPHPRGHLQAVGTDAAGRRQYRYHDAWRKRRDAQKFDRMLEFARVLPGLREQCATYLTETDEPTRERVLACSVRLLDYGFFRVGGSPSKAEVESFGLTTIRKDHVTIDGDVVQFEYTAKGGLERLTAIVNPDVREVVAALRRRRTGGPELLAWKADGTWIDVTARDVNEFIKAHAGEAYSAKDFRTWNATALAAVGVAVIEEAGSKRARKSAEVRVVKEVAAYLGNTPAVARDSYIDPRVFDRFRSGYTIAPVMDALAAEADFGQPAIHGPIEEAVVDLLGSDYRSADTVAKGSLLAALDPV
jgi:DNA topoisomerase I